MPVLLANNGAYTKVTLSNSDVTYVSGNTILTGAGTAFTKFGNLTVNKGLQLLLLIRTLQL